MPHDSEVVRDKQIADTESLSNVLKKLLEKLRLHVAIVGETGSSRRAAVVGSSLHFENGYMRSLGMCTKSRAVRSAGPQSGVSIMTMPAQMGS